MAADRVRQLVAWQLYQIDQREEAVELNQDGLRQLHQRNVRESELQRMQVFSKSQENLHQREPLSGSQDPRQKFRSLDNLHRLSDDDGTVSLLASRGLDKEDENNNSDDADKDKNARVDSERVDDVANEHQPLDDVLGGVRRGAQSPDSGLTQSDESSQTASNGAQILSSNESLPSDLKSSSQSQSLSLPDLRFFGGDRNVMTSAVLANNGYTSSMELDSGRELSMSPPPFEYQMLSPPLSPPPMSPASFTSSLMGSPDDSKIDEEVTSEDQKSTILSTENKFNENCCMRCFSRFFFLFNQKVKCVGCKYFVCKSCSDWDKELKQYVCRVCQKQSELNSQSCDWFYSNVKDRFKRFGSAKVVRSLYKRKTDSDSENDSGYDPSLYSNSVPAGKKSRQALHGLFEMDVDDPGSVKEVGNTSRGVVEEDIVISNCTSPRNSSPYTCGVSTGLESFDRVKEEELGKFTAQLRGITADIFRTLDNQSPNVLPNDNNRGQYEKLLESQRMNLSSALSSLTQSLHLAVDNQDPQLDQTTPARQTARHNLVKQIVTKEVERLAGAPIDMSEETTSEYASEDGSVTSDSHAHKPYEDLLADGFLKKILSDYKAKQDVKADKDEKDVRRSLAKLSNQATITQLSDMISESEPEDAHSSGRSRADDTTSDGESHLSDLPDPRTGHSVVSRVETSRVRSGKPNENTEETQKLSEQLSSVSQMHSGKGVSGESVSEDLSFPQVVPSGQISKKTIAPAVSASENVLPSVKVTSAEGDSHDLDRDTAHMIETDPLVARVHVSDGELKSPGYSESHRTQGLSDSFPEAKGIVRSSTPQMEGEATSGESLKGFSSPSQAHTGKISDVEEEDPVLPHSARHTHTKSAGPQSGKVQPVDTVSLSADSDNRADHSTKETERERSRKVHRHRAASPAIPDTSDSELDEIVKNNLIAKEWSKVESRKSPIISTSSEFSEKTYVRSSMSDGSRSDGAEVPVFHDNMADDQQEVHLAQRQSHIPLPSFAGSISDLNEIDFDDISRVGDDDDHMSTLETEITFERTWADDSGGIFRTRSISAYDNYGDKKVGRDVDGPVFMLIPRSDDRIPRVGDNNNNMERSQKVKDRPRSLQRRGEGSHTLEIDELSEMSENEARSDLSMEEVDSETEERELKEQVRREARKIINEFSPTTEFGVQTEDNLLATDANSNQKQAAAQKTVDDWLMKAAPTPTAAPKAPEAGDKGSMGTLVISTEGEETDPKFLLRPTAQSIPEGESVHFTCQVTGTEPIDVFWYRSNHADIVQLEEDERSDIRRDERGHYSATLYNTRKEDRGQYLCIGVNEKGRCHQSFLLSVHTNTGEKAPPEFLRGLSDLELKVGDRGKLRAKVKGYPQPRVLWYKDGKRIKNSENVKIEKLGNRDHALVVDYVSPEDDAEYTVVARNIAGEARSSAQLVVDTDSDGESRKESVRMDSGSLSPDTLGSSEDFGEQLYPETEELVKLAEQVSQTRGDVSHTAKKMMRSAGKMSSMHDQLDEMERRLDHLEDEVVDDLNKNNNDTHAINRQAIVRDHDSLQASAGNVRRVTGSALDALTHADELLQSESGTKRKSYVLTTPATNGSQEEGVELKLSFVEFAHLYEANMITREQMKSGYVLRSDLKRIQKYLQQNPIRKTKSSSDKQNQLMIDGFPTAIDCGLKRVDSKRYKRDYVVTKDTPKVQGKKWDVPLSPTRLEAEVVKGAPAGIREKPHEEIQQAEEQHVYHSEPFDTSEEAGDYPPETNMAAFPGLSTIQEVNQAEDEIYLAAGKVYSLEDRIKQLETKVDEVDEDDVSPEEMAALESKVAQAAAQVKQNDKKVHKVQQRVQQMVDAGENPAHQLEPEEHWKAALSPDRHQMSPSFPPSSMSAFYQSQAKEQEEEGRRRNKTTGDDDEVLSSQSQTSSLSPPFRGPHGSYGTSAATSVHHTHQQHTPPDNQVASPPPPQNRPSADRPTAILIRGETDAEALPESRTEVDDSQAQLPSVRDLLSMFDQSPKKDLSVRRVHSLTGRDIPQPVRDKLKQQTPSVATNQTIRVSSEGSHLPKADSASQSHKKNIPHDTGSMAPAKAASPPNQHPPQKSPASLHQNSLQKSPVAASIASPHSQTGVKQRNPVVRSTSMDSVRNKPTTANGSVANSSQSGLKKTPAPTSKRMTHSASLNEPRSPTSHMTLSVSSGPTSPTAVPKTLPVEKKKNSTIMARAAFWNKRVDKELSSDKKVDIEKFPEMPSENFKESEEQT